MADPTTKTTTFQFVTVVHAVSPILAINAKLNTFKCWGMTLYSMIVTIFNVTAILRFMSPFLLLAITSIAFGTESWGLIPTYYRIIFLRCGTRHFAEGVNASF